MFVSVCVCLSVCLSVHDNSKNNVSIHLELENIVVQSHLVNPKFFNPETLHTDSYSHLTEFQVLISLDNPDLGFRLQR